MKRNNRKNSKNDIKIQEKLIKKTKVRKQKIMQNKYKKKGAVK